MEAPPVMPPDDADVYLRAAVAALLNQRIDTPAVSACARFLREAVEVWRGLGPDWAGILQARIPQQGKPRWRRFREE